MEYIYFGTYTKRSSQGIYRTKFNSNTGQFSKLQLVAKETNPTYLTFTDDDYLYSVGSLDGRGGLACFDHAFHLLEHLVEEGAAPCYVGTDDVRNLVFTANYHTGQVLVYKRQDNGSIILSDRIQHQGSGPHPNQNQARIHFADLTPDHYLVTCDLGTDDLTTYALSRAGKVQPIGNFAMPAGAGPRHLVFHPHFKHAFVVCELNSTLQNLLYQGCGYFEAYQTISTIPEDYTGFNAPAAIAITKDGRFLYVSNRGHNSIACYTFVLDGYIHLVEILPSHGQTPRNICLTTDEHYLIVAHQNSDNVTVFKRDLDTGRLEKLSHDFQVPEAVCVLAKKTNE
ncbi:lactonase family protein [Streptococcus dentapri]|uniref:Lactonase family protein n=1 Tax=Streptococcus dentapri TaxID=573564 RepID=A0ABV8D2K7_9STRE